MTEAEFLLDFEQFLRTQFELYRKTLPYDTGNLSLNAYNLEKTATGYKIYIDLNIAPYAEYLDNKGVHQNFFENLIVNKLLQDIQNRYGGLIEW